MSYKFYAYIDILGYRNLIENDLHGGNNDFKTKLVNSFNALSTINASDVSYKSISDSIYLVFHNETLGIDYFFNIIADLQIAFLKNKLLVRGGISYNEHFENGNVTHSLALIDAYKLESNEAFYPRILIHNAIIEKLKNENKYQLLISTNKIIQHGTKHQINFLTDTNWNQCYDLIKQISEESNKQIDDDPKVFAKYWYLQDYLRRFKSKKIRFKPYLKTWG